jgi:ABC-type branched-subunit amino acid transport system substrate-binding protein
MWFGKWRSAGVWSSLIRSRGHSDGGRPIAGGRSRSSSGGARPLLLRLVLLAVPLLLLAAVFGEAVAPPPASGAASSTVDRDSTWANSVALHVERLLAAGYAYRASEWALALAAGRGWSDPRAPELLGRLPARTLSDEEFLYLGYEACRWGRAAAPALVVLARQAHEERRAVTARLVAGARALGADSSAVAAIGAGWPPAERLGFFTIGVLAPVNGELARQGEAMVRGAQLAIEEHNRSARFPLALTVGDTRSDPLVAARAAASLIEAGVGALVGDLTVETTIPAAAAAQAAAVPLVSPAPGRTDLGTIGDQIFQIIVPREVQADALARAAVRDFSLIRLVTLAPDTPLGIALADRFAAEATYLGAQMVARRVYRAGETNFQTDLEILAPLEPDAIFLAGSEPELMAAIPQLAYYEVAARVLAPEDLGSRSVLRETREFLDWAVFAEGHYGVTSLAGETFAERFMRRFRGEADAHAARGYVAARTLAVAIEAGASSRGEIRSALAPYILQGTGILVLDEAVAQVQLFQVSREGGVIPLAAARR